jgi:hypothetical protein
MPASLKEIRALSRQFSAEEIELCIVEQIERGRNICIRDRAAKDVINDLARSSFVRTMMEEHGMSLPEALRELARRIRTIHEIAKS